MKKKKIIIIKPSDDQKGKLQLVTKRYDELRKHQVNIRTILMCSNATPIRKYGGVGFMCCFCSLEFPEPRLLKNHTRRSHDETAMSLFTGASSMASFVVKLDITDLQCTLCDNCDTPFNSVEEIATHLTRDHRRVYYDDVKSHIIPFRFSDSFRCVICASQFSNFKVLLEHMNVHFRNHICEVCGKGYVNKVQFQTHTYRHNTGVFRCSMCDKVFDTRVKWKEHERATHVLMNRRSKCGYCGERFKDYTKKRDHEVRTHGASPVVLQCRACDKRFGNQRALSLHTKTYHLMQRKLPQ